MRNLGERVGLIHKLRELGRSEKFADRSHHWFRVDQIVRHGRGHFLVHGHFFFNRPLHADQADAELVLHQLADRAHAAIAQVIDVVDRTDALAQLQQVADGRVEIVGIERALVEAGRILILEQLDIELETSDLRKIVLSRIEEHAME